jgi:DNA transformation protein and related proteins
VASTKDQDFLDFIVDQLSGLRSISSRRMFGGIGLYQATTFFAIIDEGRLYFVTDDATRGLYTERGMAPFQYAPGKFIATYYEVPVDVLEDDGVLRDWARAAVAAQARRSEKRPKRKRAVTAVRRKST